MKGKIIELYWGSESIMWPVNKLLLVNGVVYRVGAYTDEDIESIVDDFANAMAEYSKEKLDAFNKDYKANINKTMENEMVITTVLMEDEKKYKYNRMGIEPPECRVYVTTLTLAGNEIEFMSDDINLYAFLPFAKLPIYTGLSEYKDFGPVITDQVRKEVENIIIESISPSWKITKEMKDKAMEGMKKLHPEWFMPKRPF